MPATASEADGTTMEWEHKGMRFTVSTRELGPLVLASARVPAVGPYVRIRPFSALGTDRDEAIELLKKQIRMEFRRLGEATFMSRRGVF